ncbi:MAG: endonuclease/exonuclease/phosphatase family protein [Paludibacteraceae bacterium]|nr:endonuclease/exonuclease/phosphatase family protein [Paludibacteraceae bacterium]
MKKENSSERKGKGLGVIRFTFYSSAILLNGVVVLCMLLGKAACYVDPSNHILPSYLGLAFPYVLLANTAFLLFWIARKKIYFLIPLIAFVICYSETRRTFSIGHDHKATGDTLSVTSYNVQMFQFFAPKEKNKTLEHILNCGSDIVCVQEFGHSTRKGYLSQKDITDTLLTQYPYCAVYENQLTWNAKIGVAILSKHPIVKKGIIDYESEHNSAIYADIVFKGDTIRVFDCHFESNKLTEEEKATLRKIKAISKDDANSVVNSVSTKMSSSYKLRARQAEVVNNLVKQTKYPIILCGDFNDVPVSYTYHTVLGEELVDSFAECGSGYGYTYNGKLFHFRIDHIMHSKEMKALQFRIGKERNSDHYPISCKIVL